MLEYVRIPLEECDWDAMDRFSDRVLFQTREWLDFLCSTQGGEPVVAAITDGPDPVGYFTGMVTRRLGLRILGSPLPGWTTSYMGFNLRPGVSRAAALAGLDRFASRSLKCVHYEVRDRFLTVGDGAGLHLDSTAFSGFEIDLGASEDELWAGLQGRCRTSIRKAEREGVTVEVANDDDRFADDFYAQLEDVFAKQRLAPTFSRRRVRALIEHLRVKDRILLLRGRAPDGRCISTAILPAMNDTMYLWGTASWRSDQGLQPNEPLVWHAMKYWKARGMTSFDLGGGGDYKRKYGPTSLDVPWFRKSLIPGIGASRELARTAFAARQRWRGRLRRAAAR